MKREEISITPSRETGILEGAFSHRTGHDRLGRVQSIFSLLEYDRLRTINDCIGHLAAAIGWQAVHIDRIFLRQRHPSLVANPIFEFVILVQASLLVVVNFLLRCQALTFEHQVVNAPAFGVHDIRIGKCRIHVVSRFRMSPPILPRLTWPLPPCVR